jgi:hypothetical protein
MLDISLVVFVFIRHDFFLFAKKMVFVPNVFRCMWSLVIIYKTTGHNIMLLLFVFVEELFFIGPRIVYFFIRLNLSSAC